MLNMQSWNCGSLSQKLLQQVDPAFDPAFLNLSQGKLVLLDDAPPRRIHRYIHPFVLYLPTSFKQWKRDPYFQIA